MSALRYFATCAVFMLAMAAVPARGADAKESSAEKQQRQLAVLQSDAPKPAKALACKQLTIYGTKEAVPALAALLADPELSSWTRIALEAIPDPAASEALRAALGKLQGRPAIGVINSLAVRRDSQAVGLLVQRLKDADAQVVAAAAVALGRIGGPDAVTALQQAIASSPAAARGDVAKGCILCAERLRTEGKSDEAIKLYDLVRAADVPKHKALEATRGAILARGAAGLPLLVEQLQSLEKARFAIGLGVAREIAGKEVTDILLAQQGRAAPGRQALLILALADRDDPKARDALMQAAKSGADAVRIAAIGGLARIAPDSCVPVLIDAALAENPELAETAIAALADLPSKQVDDTAVAQLQKAQGNARLVWIDLAGRRHVEATAPVLLKAMDDPDAKIRTAALTALGETIAVGQLPMLIARALETEKADEAKAAGAAVRAACTRMADREACADKVLSMMPSASARSKGVLLNLLVTIGGQKSLQAVAAAAKDADFEVRDAAYRALGEWPSLDAGPVLLDLVKSGDEKFQVRALRGYIRTCRQFNMPDQERLAMFRQLLPLCQRADEKRLALDILKRVLSAESLALAMEHLGSPATREAAASVAVTISDKLVGSSPAAVAEAMQKVLAATKNRDLTNKAKALLDRATKK